MLFIHYQSRSFKAPVTKTGETVILSFGSKPEEPAQPTTKICPFCMSEIDIRATRCPHCTSVQPESEADQK